VISSPRSDGASAVAAPTIDRQRPRPIVPAVFDGARPDVADSPDDAAATESPDGPDRAGDRSLAALLRGPIVSEQALQAAGVALEVTDVLALGSGMGTFVFVDALRNGGMAAESIAVMGNERAPFGRYQRYCLNSQITPDARIRSNSDACPDNLWGFPGFAVREIGGNLRHGRVRSTLGIVWSLFGETAIADCYTPRSGDLFGNMAREAKRIGWLRMLRHGWIHTIRKTREGRIVAIGSPNEDGTGQPFAVSARHLHVALGYPRLELLPDLVSYRERTGDRRHFVNAYEPHDHVYRELAERGGTVILRGRGIVASRILERISLIGPGHGIRVIHLHRSHLGQGRRYGRSGRRVDADWEFQSFNWPKGCWSGPQREALEDAGPEERRQLLEQWGGTTTPSRRTWRAIVRDGLRSGWYRPEYGVASAVEPYGDRVRMRVESGPGGGNACDLVADFIIDCTGLVGDPGQAPVLSDLIDTYELPRNLYGGFDVTNDFEIPGMRHGEARMYASGVTTLGGPFATVDSFLGLQYAGMRAVHAIADDRPPGLRRLNGVYSIRQWLRWARGVAP
jgi:hypothetical protein